MKIFVLILILLLPTSAFATTWYVIPGNPVYGTTSTTCNGSLDVVYIAGNGPNCAVRDLYDLLQWTSDDGGTTRGTARAVSGDTIILDDTGAHWPIGADRIVTPPFCTSAISYGCYFKPLPNNLKIYGKNWNTGCASKAQLYAVQGVKRIFDMSGTTNPDLECLELTDHSACTFRVGGTQCSESYGSDIGAYGRVGIYAQGGTNFTIKNVDTHGLGDRGWNISQLAAGTFDHDNLDGFGNAGLDGDIGGFTAWTGVFTINQVHTRFPGCAEVYPRSATFNKADYSGCTDQNAGGYGDGWGFNTTGGTFNITNSEWSWSTQDGLDLLYHNSGDINCDKCLFEGNDGNQFKATAKNMAITNSIFIGTCTYLTQAGKVFNTGSWSDCRANGTPLSVTPLLGSAWKFINNSAITSTGSSGSAFIEVVDRYGTANGTETYMYSNNVLKNYNNTWTAYYNGLSGAASTAWNAAVTDHSDIYNFTSAPSGTGVVTTNPNWGGTFSITASTNVPNVALGLTSPGKGNGITNIYWNNSKDYYGSNQNSPIDQGSLQYGSTQQCLAPDGVCSATTDCCTGTCAAFFCSGGAGTGTGTGTGGGGGGTISGQVISGTCILNGGALIQ